jgi:uncharacterized membrane protein YecN with MAPEG domain
MMVLVNGLPTMGGRGGAMATWIAVGIIFVVGSVAHYASLNTRVVFAVCTLILVLGLGTDWVLMGQQNRAAN